MAASIHGDSRQCQVDEMFTLLESVDQEAVEDVRKLILDDINSSGSKESWLLPILIDHYFTTRSKQIQDLLFEIRDPQCKYLLERLNDGVRSNNNKLASLELLLYILCKQPYWTHRVVEMPVFTTLIKCLKNMTDIPVLMTGVMILTLLLPIVPVSIARHLTDILDIFTRLTSFCVRKPANTPDVFLLHLHVALYSLFHRLYGMYPHYFLHYIQTQFTKKDLIPVYDEIVKPMFERVRLHPQLIVGSKESETSTSRWRNLETQDIVIECAKLSLDMVEGTWDDDPCPAFTKRYQAIQEAVKSRHNSGSTSQDTSLFPNILSQDTGYILTSLGHEPGSVCSPSVVIGLSTPPQSQRTTPATSFLDTSGHVPSFAGTITNTPMMTPQDITPRETPNITQDDPLSKSSGKGQRNTDPKRPAISLSRGQSIIDPKLTPGLQLTPGSSCVLSPMKTEFTNEPPKGAVKTQPRNAIRALEFETDRPSMDFSKKPLSTQTSLEKGTEGQNNAELTSLVTMDTLNHVVGELSTHENECIDDEVSQITQEDDLEGSFETIASPETQQAMAESVKQFMKKVNRIRFNSLNNTERLAGNESKRYHVRSNSCPPFEEEVSEESDFVTRSISTSVESNQSGPNSNPITVESSITLCDKSENLHKVILEKSRRSRNPSGNSEKISDLLARMAESRPFTILSQALFAPTSVHVCSSCHSKLVGGKHTIHGNEFKEIPMFSTFSPPELLDRQLIVGGDLHAKELNKIPLTSKESVNWTHFGGVPPADEVNILKGQIMLLHNQLMYEQHKRDLHAKRNRRLLRKITQTKTLEEQNRAMVEQRKLHEQEIQNLTVSLRLVQEENQTYKQEKESNTYEDLVKLRTTLQTNKDLEEANIGLKNLLITQREDHDKLKMQWQDSKSKLSNTEKELDILKDQVVYTQKLKEQVFKLQKEVLLMGELQQKYHERLHNQRNSYSVKPDQNYLAQSLKAEKKGLKDKLNKMTSRLQVVENQVTELEKQIQIKNEAIQELKHNLEKGQIIHVDEIKAVNDKYEAMVKVNQQFEAELLTLHSQVDQLTQKCQLRRKGSASQSNSCVLTDSKTSSDWSSSSGGGHSIKSDTDSIKTIKQTTNDDITDTTLISGPSFREVELSEQRPQSHSAHALDSLSLSSQDGASVSHGGSRSSTMCTDSEDNRSSHSNVTTDSGWWEKSTVSK
ncbi:hypothetical protein SNE40_000552 [Patella caerulea]|uniref:Hamartin n=1 Tax=Patella caerulea TaxID=87958 RepID=A0AAN8KCF6_PATCE